jgi:glycosyltransferase involved in cell wall biosynthesis
MAAPRACLFGTYAHAHSANRLLRAALEAAGYAVAECHVPLWERTRDKMPAYFRGRALARRAAEYARALPRLLAQWRALGRGADLLVAGFNGQLDVLVLRRLSGGRIPILFAPLVTVTETLVEDRQVYAGASAPARLAAWLDRAALAAADLVLADTEAHRRYLCEAFGVRPGRVGTLYLGAEVGFYADRPPDAGDARSVLFYGQYVPLHGAEVIVDAARWLGDRLHFTLVGTGPLRGAVESRARGLENVRFIDWVPYEALPQWIARADLCLGVFGTSRKGSRVIPNKVYQAAAGARPIVTGDTPAVREIFAHGTNVWLVPLGDAAALALGLATLAADGALRARLGRAARALMDGFGAAQQGARLRAILDAGLAGPGSSG